MINTPHSCTEVSKTVPILLGVSAPILENVIFCHQEDSSWPLQEGAVLKKKFDEIFDSARYTKALDSCRKIKKEHTDKSKETKAELAGLAAHKQAASNIQAEIDAEQERADRYEAEMTANEAASAALRGRITAKETELGALKCVCARAACPRLSADSPSPPPPAPP